MSDLHEQNTAGNMASQYLRGIERDYEMQTISVSWSRMGGPGPITRSITVPRFMLRVLIEAAREALAQDAPESPETESA